MVKNYQKLDTNNLTCDERLIITKFCITYGTRLQCSTNCLLRPLKMEDLEEAFTEWENAHKLSGHEIRKGYSIYVDLVFKSEKILDFHKSLNPRVTFGYSSCLHEECKCEITKSLCEELLPCIKKDEINEEYFSCGAFRYKTAEDVCGLQYEDLIIWQGEREILSTISHERIFEVFFNDEDIKYFEIFENNNSRNEKILKKMREC